MDRNSPTIHYEASQKETKSFVLIIVSVIFVLISLILFAFIITTWGVVKEASLTRVFIVLPITFFLGCLIGPMLILSSFAVKKRAGMKTLRRFLFAAEVLIVFCAAVSACDLL